MTKYHWIIGISCAIAIGMSTVIVERAFGMFVGMVFMAVLTGCLMLWELFIVEDKEDE